MEITTVFKKRKAFEYFVSSVLRQIASVENKEMIFPSHSEMSSQYGAFDIVAPNGIYDLQGLTIFEIKYNRKPYPISAAFLNELKKLDADHINLVLITNSENTKVFENFTKIRNVDIRVWDNAMIQQWMDDYPIDASNALNITETTQRNVHEIEISEDDVIEKSNNNKTMMRNIIHENDNFALVLGAGVSADPGAKNWNELLSDLTDDLKKKGIIDDEQELKKKIGDSSIITAQLCKELYPKPVDYFWAIHEGLYHKRKPLNDQYTIFHIAKIIESCLHKRHFRVLTYNFDHYLETYLDELHVMYNVLLDDQCSLNKELSIYHVHGYLPMVSAKTKMEERNKNSIFLTEENYNNLYNHPYSWQISSQLSFYRENICLFIGCSLTDPSMRRLLELTKVEQLSKHFAILTKDKLSNKDLLKACNHFARLGVEVIWANDFPEIRDILYTFYQS